MQPPNQTSKRTLYNNVSKKGMPWWGWILILVFLPILAIGSVVYPVFVQAQLSAKKSIALLSIKSLSESTFIYSVDYDNHLPLAKNWETAMATYVKTGTAFTHDLNGPSKFALNAGVGGVSTNKMKDTDTVILFFLGSNMQNSPSGGESNVLLVNEEALTSTVIGKAKWTKPNELSSYVWDIIPAAK